MIATVGCKKTDGGCSYPSCHCDTPLAACNLQSTVSKNSIPEEAIRTGLVNFYLSQSQHHVGSNNTLSAANIHVNEAMQFIFTAANESHRPEINLNANMEK